MNEWNGLAQAPASTTPSSTVTPAVVGAIGLGAIGGIFGYLTKGKTGAVVGGLLGAAAGGVAGSYVGKASASVLPAGPYKLLGTSATMLPGETYLISVPTPTGQPLGFTTAAGQAALAAFTSSGYTIVGSWDVGQTPAGWPPGDPNPSTAIHLALTNATSTAAHPGAEATVWTTGGANA